MGTTFSPELPLYTVDGFIEVICGMGLDSCINFKASVLSLIAAAMFVKLFTATAFWLFIYRIGFVIAFVLRSI